MEKNNLDKGMLWFFLSVGLLVVIISATLVDKFETLHIGNMNWGESTFFVLVAACLFWLFRRVGIDEFKLRVGKLKLDRPALYFVAALVFILVYYAYIFKGYSEFDLESFFFMLTMPGLLEELFFRGLLLGILNRLFDKKFSLFGVKFGWGLILVSFGFGVLHILNYLVTGDSTIDQLMFTLTLTTVAGFLFGFLAEATGGLLLPILVHNGLNVVRVVFFAFG